MSNSGTYTARNAVAIGSEAGGTGNFNVSSGGTVVVAYPVDVYLGLRAGSTGTLTVTGMFSVWDGSGAGDLYVGGSPFIAGGTGTVNVLAGGTLLGQGAIYLGRDNASGGTGTLNISGTGSNVTLTTASDALFVGYTGTGALNISNGGQLTNDGYAYVGHQPGSSGTVIIDGAGSVWTSFGPATVIGGNDGNAAGGTGGVTVRNGGTFNTFDALLGNDLDGVSKGTVNVTGAGSTWNANSIFVGYAGTGTLNITNGGTVNTNGSLSIAECFCSTGTLNVSGRSTLAIGGNLLIGNSGTGTMTVSGAGTAVTTGGDLSAGVSGTATLTIRDGASVAINGGGTSFIAQNNGSSGTITVTGAGSLLTVAGDMAINPFGVGSAALNLLDGGQATIVGPLVNLDRLTVGAGSAANIGGYFQGSTASANIGLRSAVSGLINAGVGPAALGGALIITGHNAGRTTYTLVRSGTLGGTTFDTVTYAEALRNPVLTYTASNVLLTVDAFQVAATLPLNANTNQRNVATALDNAVAGGAVLPTGLDYVFNLTGDALLNALSQLAGQPGASVAQTSFTASGQFINAVFDGAFVGDAGQGGAASFAQDDALAANAYAPKRKMSQEAKDAYKAMAPRDRVAPSFNARWNVWASAYGGNSRVNGDAGTGSSTTTAHVFGIVAGASYRFTPDTLAGFAVGGAGSSFGINGGYGLGRADILNAAVYAKHTFGSAYLAGMLGYSWQDTTTERTVTIAGTDQLRASFKAQALLARLEGGWRYATPMAGVTPYAALQTTTFFLPSYGETATSGSNQFALSYASKAVTATRGELGAKFDKAMLVGDAVLTLKARTAWAHDWNTDRSAVATFQTLPAATFTVNGAQPSSNAGLLSLGADMKWNNGWSLAGSFDGEFSRTTASYAGKGAVRYAW